MLDCLFCKIGKHEIPKEFVLETDQVMVFPDIHPMAPVHLLIVPKKHIKEFNSLGKEEQKIWEEMTEVSKRLIEKYGLMGKGYRLTINGGGTQLIDHLHIHLMGKIVGKKPLGFVPHEGGVEI